jgi:hypothetical protein
MEKQDSGVRIQDSGVRIARPLPTSDGIQNSISQETEMRRKWGTFILTSDFWLLTSQWRQNPE